MCESEENAQDLEELELNDESYSRYFNIKRKGPGNYSTSGARLSIEPEPQTGMSKSKNDDLNKEDDDVKTSLL